MVSRLSVYQLMHHLFLRILEDWLLFSLDLGLLNLLEEDYLLLMLLFRRLDLLDLLGVLVEVFLLLLVEDLLLWVHQLDHLLLVLFILFRTNIFYRICASWIFSNKFLYYRKWWDMISLGRCPWVR